MAKFKHLSRLFAKITPNLGDESRRAQFTSRGEISGLTYIMNFKPKWGLKLVMVWRCICPMIKKWGVCWMTAHAKFACLFECHNVFIPEFSVVLCINFIFSMFIQDFKGLSWDLTEIPWLFWKTKLPDFFKTSQERWFALTFPVHYTECNKK